MAALSKTLLCVSLLFGLSLLGRLVANDVISGGITMGDRAMYRLPHDVQTRWASIEDPDAEKDGGG